MTFTKLWQTKSKNFWSLLLVCMNFLTFVKLEGHCPYCPLPFLKNIATIIHQMHLNTHYYFTHISWFLAVDTEYFYFWVYLTAKLSNWGVALFWKLYVTLFYRSSYSCFLTIPTSSISESCIKIEINLHFYFHTSLWCLKRFYEGLQAPH